MNRGRWRQLVRGLIKLFHFPEISHVESLLNELGEKEFGDNVQTKGCFLNRQHNVVCSSRDQEHRVGLQDRSMVEDLVKGFQTSPNHLGFSSSLETGGWQFIDHHGHMRHLNKVNISGFHRSQAEGKVFFGKTRVAVNVNHPLVGIFEQSICISQQAFRCFFPHHLVGSKFFRVISIPDGPFEIIQLRLFYANGLNKTAKHTFCVGLLVDDANSDLALPRSIFQRIGFLGQRHGHHSGRNVLKEGINRVHDE
ncbi:uncharacterized protein TNCV_1708591 [Trichonephila clavipes]|nr:uncharacterized protein TNCV_1708591 [Trichonephila clavipes]